MESCPNDFSAVLFTSYSKRPADVFNQSLCVPSIDLKTTKLVSHVVLACVHSVCL